MLWGRLDACLRAHVSALLNDPADKASRDGFVKSLQEAIISRNPPGGRGLIPRCRHCSIGTLVPNLKDKIRSARPAARRKIREPWPKPPIFSGDDRRRYRYKKHHNAEVAYSGQNRGKRDLFARAPQSPALFLNHWLVLLGVMSVLNIIVGRLAGKSEVDRFGWFGLAAVILLALLASVLGTSLLKKSADDNKLPNTSYVWSSGFWRGF